MYNHLLIVLSMLLTLEGSLISARTMLLSPSSGEDMAEDMPPPWKDNEYLDDRIFTDPAFNNDKTLINNYAWIPSNDHLARKILENTQAIPIFSVEDLPTKHHHGTQENLHKYEKYILAQLKNNNFGNSASNSKDDETLIPIDLSTKRGLSMLSRWKPFSDIGRDRSPIRAAGELKSYGSEMMDGTVVSAQTRARPAGQPLRWG